MGEPWVLIALQLFRTTRHSFFAEWICCQGLKDSHDALQAVLPCWALQLT